MATKKIERATDMPNAVQTMDMPKDLVKVLGPSVMSSDTSHITLLNSNGADDKGRVFARFFDSSGKSKTALLLNSLPKTKGLKVDLSSLKMKVTHAFIYVEIGGFFRQYRLEAATGKYFKNMDLGFIFFNGVEEVLTAGDQL